MAKGKGEKISEALPSGTEMFIQQITGSQEEGLGNIFMLGLTK